MNFSVSNPKAFFLFIPLVLAVIFVTSRYNNLRRTLSEKNSSGTHSSSLSKLQHCFWSRTFFRILAATMVILAAAGFSWGTAVLPVQKTGRNVAMVFDISYSMEANDAPGGITRLEAASNYATELLEHMGGTKVSVVLAKGDGIIAVPMTEDFSSVRILIDCLSPSLMTASGTSLGNGIKSAISSFPSQSGAASFIWLFTDGEETDNSLQQSLSLALKSGIPVCIIGFGSERESEILAGDRTTKIKTALRSHDIEKIIDSLKKKNSIPYSALKMNALFPSVSYIDASEMGSATSLLKMLSLASTSPSITYEFQNVKHHRSFIILGILFFALSFLFAELNISRGKKKFLAQMAAGSVVLSMLTSCSPRMSYGEKILAGKLAWDHENYQAAVADFLETACDAKEDKDAIAEEHAVFGLGTTYLMQGETDAALARYSEITENASDSIKFAVLYNSGIIAHRRGDYEKAADYFKKSLLIDSSSTDARINLELSLQEETTHAQLLEKELIPVNETAEDHSLENTLYSVIREDETKQWKSQQSDSERSPQDY